MWNIIYTNTTCNNFNRLMEHRGHLERIALAKKMIDTKTPNQPKFFKEGACKKAMKREFNRQIDIDNNLLYKKMYEIKIHPSPYSKCMNLKIECPAFESLTYNKMKRERDIQKENGKLKKRLISARPAYNTKRYLDDYKYTSYIEKNISKNAKQRNPNLNFTTYNGFKNNLKYNIERCFDESSTYGLSSTTGSKSNNNFRPSSSKSNYTISREVEYQNSLSNYNNNVKKDNWGNNVVYSTTDAYTHS